MVKAVSGRHLCRNKYKWHCNNPRVRSKMKRNGAQSTLRAPISVLKALKWLIQCLPILPYLDRPGTYPYKSSDAMLPNKQAVVVGKYQHTLHYKGNGHGRTSPIVLHLDRPGLAHLLTKHQMLCWPTNKPWWSASTTTHCVIKKKVRVEEEMWYVGHWWEAQWSLTIFRCWAEILTILWFGEGAAGMISRLDSFTLMHPLT